MKINEIKQILEKIEECKSNSGQLDFYRPVLSSLISFVSSVVGEMEEIGVSIKESSRDVPKATNQLERVTLETEAAATEMLDTVEKIMTMLDDINKNIAVIKKGLKVLSGNNGNIIDFRKEKYCLNNIQDSVNRIQDYSFSLLNSLQFQDITTQQIKGANYILTTMRNHLNSLVGTLEDVDFDKYKNGRGDFDSNATIKDADIRQSLADEIINTVSNKKEAK